MGERPAQPGLDTAGVLTAVAAGSIDTLVLLGADLEEDFPDRIRMRAGLDVVGFTIVVGVFAADASARADVFLPTTVWGEKVGSMTNLEGRVMRQARSRHPRRSHHGRLADRGGARGAPGTDFGFDTVEDVQDEIARVAPADAGVDSELILRGRYGAVLPVADFPDEITFHRCSGSRPDGRGSRSSPGSPPTSRTSRRWAPASSNPAAPAPRRRSSPGSCRGTPPRTRPRPMRRWSPPPTSSAWPPLHRWDRAATAPAPAPPDVYSLRLVAARTLYDAGRIVSSSPSLAGLATGFALVVHPSDLGRIGLSAEADDVRVTSVWGTITLPVLADAATAPGTAFMPFASVARSARTT